MTGRIEALGTESTPGSIKAENGVSALFYASKVVPHGVEGLAVGQLVTFELERGDSWKAINIFVEKQHYKSHEAEKRRQAIRYMGFEQTGNIRAYKFERILPIGEPQTATVTTDLALFAKHHVGMQEGPALCLRLVMAELDDTNADEGPPLQRSLTDQDMVTHLASRAVPQKKRYGISRPNAANSRAAKHSALGTGPRTTS